MNKLIKVDVLGVPIARLKFNEISNVLVSLIKRPGKKTIFYADAHSLWVANQDCKYKRILLDATLVYPGGIGPVWASKIISKRKSLIERMTTPDFIDQIFSVVQDRGWKIYFLGGTKEVVEKTVKSVLRKFPRIRIVGYHDGYFNAGEERLIVKELNFKKPKIIFVGMGLPKQEKWVTANKDKVNVEVFFTVGGMFDMISGTIPRAPIWMQDLGLEWLFRLVQEPRRLWRRYTLGNLGFLYLVLKELNKFRN